MRRLQGVLLTFRAAHHRRFFTRQLSLGDVIARPLFPPKKEKLRGKCQSTAVGSINKVGIRPVGSIAFHFHDWQGVRRSDGIVIHRPFVWPTACTWQRFLAN